MKSDITVGNSFPIGATIGGKGVNFCVFSRGAERIDLLFFDRDDDKGPSRAIGLEGAEHRHYHYWHVFVPGIKAGQIYAYRAHGKNDPARGLRFDGTKLLLDPYGRGVAVPKNYSRQAASGAGDNSATAMKSVVIDPNAYDWEGDRPLRHPSSQTIIYEMHVRGFTRNPNSGVSPQRRGTYAGLIEKIPYLKDLGITAVELLPVFQFDAQDALPGRVNYWGYSPVSFFAPHAAYSSRLSPTGPVDEFRDMVKALHRAGIEVILDVVYNHTAEGNADGPTLCLKGFDNDIYYHLENDRSRYANYSGTGNTLNTNNPVVRRMILDSLRYWVSEMHVDGFRFDLASIMSRDEAGNALPRPPILWDIESDPVLAGTKLIAEAWDAAGLYQVGNFIGDAWKEWNGRFRDDVRGFFRRDPGMIGRLANRLIGSPDIYEHKDREAEQSVNFVTCHDGFTLNDLVSYDVKHNEANGENNADGTNDNRSWNCGVEGPIADPAVEGLRNRQVKNFIITTMISLGMPMLLMGDEVRRTQRGNNNTFCQDNEISWFDWDLLSRHADVLRFVRTIAKRRSHRSDSAERRHLSLNQLLCGAKIEWHGIKLGQPDFTEQSHSLAMTVSSEILFAKFHMILNAYCEALEFELPKLEDGRCSWRRLIDTALPSPDDIAELEDAPRIEGPVYRAIANSVVILMAG